MASTDGQVLCLNELASPAPYLHPQTSGIEDEALAQKELAKSLAKTKSPDKKPKPKVVKRKE